MKESINKTKYRELCLKEKSIPLFSRDWWLDAVCFGNNWDVAIVEKGGNIYATMPYCLTRQYGFSFISMPPLTQTMGPWIRYPENQKYEKRLSFEKQMMGSLIQQLPRVAVFKQNFHHSVKNWLPFYWQDFKQTTRYTYRIDNLSNLDDVMSCIQSRIKTDIKKAKDRYLLSVVHESNIDVFLQINEKTFSQKGENVPYQASLVRKLDTACRERECRKIFLAKDTNDQVHAGIYLVWDENSAYYLMGGGDQRLRNSGATSLVLWEAIKFAATVTKKFDFEGSMIDPIENFFRGFGAHQTPFFSITKFNSRLFRLLFLLKESMKK